MSCITTIKINGLTVTSKLQPKILEILKDNPHLVLDEVNYFLDDNDKLDSINQLTEDHYEEIAGEYYNHFLEEDFINSFGNWQNSDSSINQNNIYVTGEPKLHFDKSLKKWYYRDKYANKVFYPFEQNGLNFIYPNEAITEGVKFLAYKFFQSNFNKDYNNLNFVTKDSLKETIRMIINQKINETKDTDKDYIADELRESLFYLDEWVDKVRNYFYSLNFKVEDVEAEVITEEENSTSELIRTSSFEKNSKDAVGANVKAFLSFIPNIEEVDTVFEESSFVDFDDIWNTLQKELANLPQTIVDGNIEDGYKLMISKIEELASKKTYFKELLNILNQPNLSEEKKSEFFQAFSLAKNPFFVTEVKINNKGLSFDVKDVSNVNTKEKTIKNEWGLNFNSLFINENNKVEFDKIKSIQTDLETLKSDLSILLKVIDNKNQLDRPINKLLKIFRDLGVETTEKAFNSWIDINSSQDAIIEKLVNTINNTNRLTKDIISRKVNPLKSNVFNSQSLFLDLAKEEAFFLEDGSDSSIFSSGKTYWIFSYPSYLHNEVNSWKRNRNELEKIYLEKGNESSELLKYLLGYDQKWSNDELRIQESNKRINSFKIGVFNVLQEKKEDGITSDPKNNVQLSKDDSIADIVNKSLLKKIGQRSIFNTPTPADKATSYLVQHGLFFDNNTDFNPETKKPTVSGEVVNIFYNYFKTEYQRMRSEYEVINNPTSKKVVHYHLNKGNLYNNGFLAGNAFKSQIFPSLSFDKIKSTSPLHGKLYGADGKALLDSLDKYETIIKQQIENVISAEIMNTHQALVHKGVFQISDQGNIGGYINKAIDNRIFKGYAEDSLYPTLAIAGDYYVNTTINLIEYSKVFSGDPAYYKNMVDYAKRIPATYTDGLPLRLLNNDELFFNAAVISGVEIDSPYLKELEKLVGKDIANMYKGVNTTDAQAWITPKRWEFIMKRAGLWKDSLHNDAFDKMMGVNKEPFTSEELKAVAQPLKGVYFKKNNGIPVYLKYSQAVLLPDLVKGSQLEQLYNRMIDENNPIDEVITIDGVKVGSLTPSTIHDNNGNLLNDFTLESFQLDNRGWKLQQNLPTKNFKDTTVGSQIQKNALAGLAFNLDNEFTVSGKTKSGLEMYKSLNAIIGRLSEIGVEKLIDELGLDNDNKITNPKSLYSLLIKEAKRRNINDNLIEALQKELSIYGIPQAHKKLLNMFFAITNDRLVKVKTNGGSMIQISNFGLDKVEDIEKAGIKWFIDPEKGLKPPHIEDGVIKPGQILLPGSLIAKQIPNWKDYSANELKEIIDPEILNSIIGYRIPNQGLSSNDALKIVGFLPEGMGDAVVAYSEIPTKTGSDFDIDKMYMMIPSFELDNKGKLKYIKPSLDKDGNELSIEYQPKEAIQNMLIQHYKSIFINENVIKDIMTPIDFDYIKEHIISMFPEKEGDDLYNFNALNQIDLKYDFLAGKAGVGQTANMLVDHVRGMFINLTLKNTYIGWGNYLENSKTNVNETVFDKEYSEELNSKDAKYIAEQLGITVEEVKSFKITNSISAFLNAFVDIAKDPYVTRGNWTTLTSNTGFMMLRAGVHPYYVNSFIGQPIIKDYIDFVNNSESKINKNTGDLQNKFRKELVNRKLKGKSIKIGNKELSYIQLNNNFRYKEPTVGAIAKKFEDYKATEHKDQIQQFLDELMEVKLMFEQDLIPVQTLSLQDLNEQITIEDDFTIQWSILQEFFKLQELSKNLVGSINASKVDVNGAGKDLSSRFVSENLINNMIESEKMETTGSIIGFKDKLIDPNTNEETILGHYVNNSISFVNDILKANPKLFLMSNENIEKTFNKISNELKNENLMSQALADRLYSSYYSYLMSGFKPLKSENYVQDLFKDLSTKVLKAKSESDNYFLQQLEIVEEAGYNFIKLDNRKRSKSNQNKMYLGWKDLMNEFPEISDQLVQYSFYQSGFQNNINEFFSHIPHEYFAENNLNQFIFEANKRIGNVQLKFIDQFYRNNWQDGLIVPNIFANQIKSLHKGVSFTLDNPENISQPRFVKLDNTLAELVGYATSGNGIYFKTYKLGQDLNNGKIYEYSFDKNITSKISTNIPNNIKEIEKIKSEFEPTFGIEYFDKNNNVVETEEEINNEQQNEEFIDPLNIEENINPSDKSEC